MVGIERVHWIHGTAERAVMWTIMAFFALLVAWASLGELEIVVIAQGRVVPSGRVKEIQTADAGVVRAIHVADGDRVKAGDVLVELDGTAPEADRRLLQAELAAARLEVARLTAQAAGRPDSIRVPENADPAAVDLHRNLLRATLSEHRERIAVLDRQIAGHLADAGAIRGEINQLEESLPLHQGKLERRERLATRKLMADSELIDIRLEVIEKRNQLEILRQRLDEARARIWAVRRERALEISAFRRKSLADLSQAVARRDAARQELVKADERRERQFVRAPVTGVVQQLSVNTIRGVVRPAETLMVVVPAGSSLEVQGRVRNQDIGFVNEGQPVQVKVAAYDFTRYGSLPGELQWVAEDAVVEKDGSAHYPVRIALLGSEMPRMVNGRSAPVTLGMSVSADIIVGKRRVIEYFLGPLLRYRDQSLRES